MLGTFCCLLFLLLLIGLVRRIDLRLMAFIYISLTHIYPCCLQPSISTKRRINVLDFQMFRTNFTQFCSALEHFPSVHMVVPVLTCGFFVCSCSPVVDGWGSGEVAKHLHFTWVSLFSELELAQWQSQGFWYLLLLMASLWVLRLYLHYLGQWLFLWALSTPVTK